MNDVSYNRTRLLYLIKKVPNWETYLTDKQLEATKLYLSTLDVSMVAIKLDLTNSTIQSRLFGKNDSKGALGKLEEVYNKFVEFGYFNKEKPKVTNNVKPILSDKTLEKTKELFDIINKLEDYQSYLTQSQNEKLDKFLSTRSFKQCAKHFGINESSFKQSILGRDETSGILGRLKKEYNKKYINDWDKI